MHCWSKRQLPELVQRGGALRRATTGFAEAATEKSTKSTKNEINLLIATPYRQTPLTHFSPAEQEYIPLSAQCTRILSTHLLSTQCWESEQEAWP